MSFAFRNVEGSPDQPVDQWPYEAIVATIERGTLQDWIPVINAIRTSPWGVVARQVEEYLGYESPYGVGALLRSTIARARASAEASERAEVARRVRACVERSGLSREEFARALGTSRSRLSTYCSGAVMPSAALLVRMERLAS
ncbi:helix-turn-helix domain-containing protein [Hoyosella altamirensis]|uniref:DNA-binding transcriptional regulator YiaG n=1 Tax=Hoyosella altamirensis TaxID=616997 RepID=A0A839RK08_9ACTN|nr:helix-turn-helix transcriptional regulator [Hoyosella altamirensis]MBB3036995.1 DNA-binding transcriptional regulator YiaG [Hoyosella altamirensis]